MRYLVLLTPTADADASQFEPYRIEEERRLWEQYASGVVRHMYFQERPLRVVLDFEADSRELVEAQLATLPMIAAGLFEIDIVQLGPWLPLAALFGEQMPGAALVSARRRPVLGTCSSFWISVSRMLPVQPMP